MAVFPPVKRTYSFQTKQLKREPAKRTPCRQVNAGLRRIYLFVYGAYKISAVFFAKLFLFRKVCVIINDACYAAR